MKKIILILFILIFTGCKKDSSVKANVFVYDSVKAGKLELLADSIIQGKPVVVRYYKKHEKEADIYCSYMYYIKNDNRFNTYRMKSPSKTTANYFEFVDTVPQGASGGFISAYNPNITMDIDHLNNIVILKTNGKYEEGAAGNRMVYSADTSNYMNYFNYEREVYPDNYIAYAQKWSFELNNKIFTHEIANEDYKIIYDATNIDTATKTVLLFIIKSLRDKVVDRGLLSKIVKFKDVDVLNSDVAKSMLMKVIKHHLGEEEGGKTLAIIAYNNPLSRLTETAFMSGELINWMKKDMKDSLLEIGSKFYKSAPERSENIIYYLRCIEASGYDSSAVVLRLCEKLFDRLEKQEQLKSGIDRNNNLFLLKSFIYQGIVSSYKKLNKLQDGVDFMKKYDKYTKNYEKEKYSYYWYLAELFEDISPDSACIYYAKANKVYPNIPPLQRNFKKYILKARPDIMPDSAIAYLDSLSNAIIFEKEVLAFDTPIIELENGKRLNLNNLDKPLILFNSSATCTFCHQEIESLGESKLSNINYKPLLLFIDKDDFELSKSKGLLPKNFDCQLIKNGDMIKKYLNITITPTTVIINNKNELTYFSSGFDGNISGILNALIVK